jgi:hypothetical protein
MWFSSSASVAARAHADGWSAISADTCLEGPTVLSATPVSAERVIASSLLGLSDSLADPEPPGRIAVSLPQLLD